METYRFKVGILRLKWCKHLYRLVTATSLHLAFVEGCNRVIVLEFNQQDVLGPTRWSKLLGYLGFLSSNLTMESSILGNNPRFPHFFTEPTSRIS